jgi:hypothetical protein
VVPEIGSLALHFNSRVAHAGKIGAQVARVTGLEAARRLQGARQKSVTQFKVNGT